eukprot:CAMPEP_0119123052 /NCGR_PEP_ID=MMETSP1310-20130426/3117_1 /TAXON_ID=464262 /ORGANISM="Genus nov. species nov., Strain RCC2339" /LENGTH=708 /DNA_ID=CAMNT_0007112799 /DNA_START=257 /DNA_END=2379 /DNA_ORIENTATION=-
MASKMGNSVVEDDMLMLKVVVPVLTLSKRMLFTASDDIASVVHKIARKLKLPEETNASKYGIYLPLQDVWCSDTSRSLASYGLINLDEVEFRMRASTRISLVGYSVSPMCKFLGLEAYERRDSLPPAESSGEGIFTVDVLLPQDKRVCRVVVSYGTPCSTVVETIRDALQQSIEHLGNYGLVSDICDENGTHRLDFSVPLETEFGSMVFCENTVLKLKPVQVVVLVEIWTATESMETRLALRQHTDTVKRIKEKLLARYGRHLVNEASHYDLMLTFGKDPFKCCGLILKDENIIASYPITSNDILRLGTRKALQQVNFVKHNALGAGLRTSTLKDSVAARWDDSWIDIECGEHPLLGALRATFLLDLDLLVAEVKRLFWHTFPSEESAMFHMRYFQGQVKKIPEDMRRFRSLGLANGSTIQICRSLKKGLAGKNSGKLVSGKRPGVKKGAGGKVFGTDLDLLEKESSHGFQVPIHLLKLKEALDINNGLHIDGLFRQAGAEDVVKLIIDDVNRGTYTPKGDLLDNDCHAIATVIKRWISEIPNAVLGAIPDEMVSRANTNVDAIVDDIYDVLPRSQRDVFKWIVELLGETALYAEENRMTAENLAIIFAPILIDFPDDDPMKGVALNKTVVSVLHTILDRKVEELRAAEAAKGKPGSSDDSGEPSLGLGVDDMGLPFAASASDHSGSSRASRASRTSRGTPRSAYCSR